MRRKHIVSQVTLSTTAMHAYLQLPGKPTMVNLKDLNNERQILWGVCSRLSISHRKTRFSIFGFHNWASFQFRIQKSPNISSVRQDYSPFPLSLIIKTKITHNKPQDSTRKFSKQIGKLATTILYIFRNTVLQN